jgi:multiple antibiotic resistance protein
MNLTAVVDFSKVLLTAFMTLFPVVNPVGCAPIFLALTQQYPVSTQQMLSRKVAFYGFALLAISCLFGSLILEFFGISLPVIQIAGGIVVASAGWGLLNQKDDADKTAAASQTTLDDAMEHAFYPLTLPITVGPGCISIAITIGAHLRHQAGPGFEHGYPRHFIAAISGMFLLCVLVWFCYSRANRLVKVLGKNGTAILVRLSAFILFAIGVQILWNGLGAAIPAIYSLLPGH